MWDGIYRKTLATAIVLAVAVPTLELVQRLAETIASAEIRLELQIAEGVSRHHRGRRSGRRVDRARRPGRGARQ